MKRVQLAAILISISFTLFAIACTATEPQVQAAQTSSPPPPTASEVVPETTSPAPSLTPEETPPPEISPVPIVRPTFPPTPTADPSQQNVRPSVIYDQPTLDYWNTRFPKSNTEMYNVLLGFLEPEEKRVFADVELSFPLVEPGELGKNPFLFYAIYDPPTIGLPVMSTLFLNDLSIAWEWLELNGCTAESAIDYVLMLKYNPPSDFVGGHYPEPLKALHIPDDALDDPDVDTFSLGLFNSARAFIIAHEMGHIYHDHGENAANETLEDSQRKETEADLFALELLRRVPEMPVGASIFFSILSHWEPNRWDFPDREAWETYLKENATHPLTSDRMRNIAEFMEANAEDFARNEPDFQKGIEQVHDLAGFVTEIAVLLEDEEFQQGIALKGRTVDVQSLTPRCANAPAVPTTPGNEDANVFEGTYLGKYIRIVPDVSGGASTEDFDIELNLQRVGDDLVIGRFNFGFGDGTIRGVVIDQFLFFEWEWSIGQGQGVFETSNEGNSFFGTWGYNDQMSEGGTWDGQRQ